MFNLFPVASAPGCTVLLAAVTVSALVARSSPQLPACHFSDVAAAHPCAPLSAPEMHLNLFLYISLRLCCTVGTSLPH